MDARSLPDRCFSTFHCRVIGAHQPHHALAVDAPTQLLQFNDDPSRTVAPVLKTDLLDLLAQFRVRLARQVLRKLGGEFSGTGPSSYSMRALACCRQSGFRRSFCPCAAGVRVLGTTMHGSIVKNLPDPDHFNSENLQSGMMHYTGLNLCQ
jgi:hypothetical protein